MKRLALLARIGLVGLVGLAAAGCNPSLFAQSVAPPGRTAKLAAIEGFWGTKAYAVELSQGVALAVTCHHGGPCQGMSVASADPTVAAIRRAALTNKEPQSPYMRSYGETNSAGFVLLGMAPGKTRVDVKTSDGSRTIFVTIVPPPPFGNEATRATTALRID